MKTDLTQKFSQPYISAVERNKTVLMLEKKITRYESDPRNRDGRGVRHQTRKQVDKTTSQLKHAFRHRENHPDSTIRHEAGVLIKKIFHLEFEKLTVEASAFRGKLSKSTQRYKEKRRQEGAQLIPISNSLALKEVCTTRQLTSIGKTLQNCVGNRSEAHYYMGSVERGRSQLWTLLRNGKVCGLMNIEVKYGGSRKSVEECSTFGNEYAVLSHDEAMEILRKLQITNVEAESFALVGAYPILLNSSVRDPLPNPIKVDRKWHYIWRTEGQLTLATTSRHPRAKLKFRPEKLNWSQFSESGNEYHGPFCNYLSDSQLLGIVLQSREFREALEDIRPTGRIEVNQALHQPRISSNK